MIDDNKIESKHDGRIDDYDYVCILWTNQIIGAKGVSCSFWEKQ